MQEDIAACFMSCNRSQAQGILNYVIVSKNEWSPGGFPGDHSVRLVCCGGLAASQSSRVLI